MSRPSGIGPGAIGDAEDNVNRCRGRSMSFVAPRRGGIGSPGISVGRLETVGMDSSYFVTPTRSCYSST
jgi:hypothetical protein